MKKKQERKRTHVPNERQKLLEQQQQQQQRSNNNNDRTLCTCCCHSSTNVVENRLLSCEDKQNSQNKQTNLRLIRELLTKQRRGDTKEETHFPIFLNRLT
jgi:hypothetical protein